MTTTTRARHRADAPALTPLAGAAVRRSLAVAATSGLAVTMIASSASADGDEDAVLAASAGTLRVGPAAEAVGLTATNAAFSVDVASAEAAAVDVSDEVPAVEVETRAEAEARAAAEAVAAEAAAQAAAEVAAAEAAAQEAAAAQATTQTVSQETASTATSTSGSTVTEIAMSLVGSAYVWGAAGPYAFDCSGLVSYVYAQVGVSVPHSSSAIRSMSSATVISAAEAQPGDIMWWSGHVAIYAGDGMMVSAESEAVGVRYMAVRSGAVYLRVNA